MSNSRGVLVLGLLVATCAAETGWPAGVEPPPAQELFTASRIENPDTEEVKRGEEWQQGFFRKTFELPSEAVFSAIVNAAWVCELWVNGQQVPRFRKPVTSQAWMYWLRGADIVKHLRPGRNAIGLRALQGGHPLFIYLQGDVVLASGEAVHLATDGTWKFSRTASPDWSDPSFDDSSWKPARVAGSAHHGYLQGQMPAYSGRLVIQNPREGKLFYTDTREVSFRVRIPAGLARLQPTLALRVNRAEDGEEVKTGSASVFRVEGPSGTCEFSVGRLPRGVYVLSLILTAGEKEIERRLNEPFIVCGKIPQKEVEGRTFEEGMNLSLYDTINCADPKDPHPYLEGGFGQTRVVTAKGLSYRETGPGRGKNPTSFFAYKAKFGRISEPYLVVFEYPDDAKRWIEFSINTMPDDPEAEMKRHNVWAFHRESGGAICGERFPPTGKVRRFPILYFPNREEATLIVNTAAEGCPAAASRILIYRVGEIPALKVHPSGQRFLGLHTERGYSFHRMFDGAPEKQSQWWVPYWSPKTFAIWFRTLERYAQYLRFAGQNLHVIGCFQYDEGNSAYADLALVGGKTARLEGDFREVAAKVFSENGIALMASVELTHINSPHASGLWPVVTDQQVAGGADTVWCMSREGKQIIGGGGPGGAVPNIFHPLVQQRILEIVEDLCRKLADSPAFRGFYFIDLPGLFGFVPGHESGSPEKWLECGFEDVTVELFEKDTGISVPVDPKDTRRFAKRYNWIMANAKREWIDWRCRKVREVRLLVLQRMRQYRKDLRMISGYHDWGDWSAAEYAERLKADGQDLSLYRSDDGISIARYAVTGGGWGPTAYLTGLRNLTARGATASFERPTNRTVVLKNIFDENILRKKFTPEWPWGELPGQVSTDWAGVGLLVCGPPESPGEHFAWPFAQVTEDSDPDTLLFGWGDDQILPGHEQATRDFARGFLSLPAGRFKPVVGQKLDSNLIVRELREAGQVTFYILNPLWARPKVQLSLSGVMLSRKVLDLTEGTRAKTVWRGSKCDLLFTLPPYGLRGFAVEKAPEARVVSVMGEFDATAADPIRSRLATAKGFLSGRRVSTVLAEAELALVRGNLDRAEKALAAGRYVEAWRLLVDTRFETLVWDKAAHAEHITPWLTIGPFANDEAGDQFRRQLDVERDALAGRVDVGKDYKGLDEEGQPCATRWRRMESGQFRGEENFVDFDEIYSPNENVLAYAVTYVYSPAGRRATIAFGSDDGGRVWLNGRLVIDRFEARAAKRGEDTAPVDLPKGWSQVLVKVEERIGAWGFFLDFLGEDGKPLGDLEHSAEPRAMGDR